CGADRRGRRAARQGTGEHARAPGEPGRGDGERCRHAAGIHAPCRGHARFARTGAALVMPNPLRFVAAWLDARTARGSRHLARGPPRRSFITRLGGLLTGAAVLPLLPVARAFSADRVQDLGDPESCEYWRYCALSGTLCACCGGTANQCPPGAEL